MYESQLRAISEEFNRFPVLEKLTFIGNTDLIDFTNLARLDRITGLCFCENGISEIPASVFKMKSSITSLKLSNESFKEIPSSLFKLTRLENLMIECMPKITVIPGEIENLVNLKKLSLSGNGIKKLPEQLFNLTNLQTLDLSKNREFSDLPESIHGLPNLRYLDLDNTAIEKLPFAIATLQHMNTLAASDTRLGEIPVQICMLLSLYSLEMRPNERITSLINTAEQIKLFKDWYIRYRENYRNLGNSIAISDAYRKNMHTLENNMINACQSNKFGLFALENLKKLELPERLIESNGLTVFSTISAQLAKINELYGCCFKGFHDTALQELLESETR